MDMQEFFANLPRGKEDKPMLLAFGDIPYNCDDVDGLYYMLDRAFSGCIVLNFVKPMDPDIPGRATLDGVELPPCILKHMPIMMNMWALGIPLRGYATEYGKSYTLHVEGFTDTDGNEMAPTDLTVKVNDRVLPRQEYAEHEAIALQAAREGIVLMKNNGLLPLKKGTILNLFGKAVHQFRTGAVGAGKINPRYTVNFLNAVRESTAFGLNESLVDFYRCDGDLVPPGALLAQAREQSDVAVMLITRGCGENLDNSSAKGEYYLSGEEENLLAALRKEFAHVVVILNVGFPMDVSWAEKYGVDAVLYNGFGGMLAGQALCDVLSGKENPGGKLPDTWAKDYFHIPASRNFYDCVDKPRLDAEQDVYVDTVYEEGIYVGYRYFHTFGVEPAYPFGFGLSYTTFDVCPGEMDFDGQLKLKVTVTNIGHVPGKEAVQVYIRKPESLCETPERELVWFAKTTLLQPGESQTLTAVIAPKDMAVFDTARAAWVMPAGEYTLFVGADSTAPKWSHFIAEEILVQQVSHLMLPVEAPEELSKYDANSFPKGSCSGVKAELGFSPRAARRSYPAAFTLESCDKKLTYQDVKADPTLVHAFVSQLSVAELARISVCASAGWGMEGIGEAGRIFRVEGLELPDFPVSDGNSGVNLNIPNIGMPSGATLAASFDPDLLEQVGRVIGEEAKALGMPLILAPGMNLHRNPLNGRQPEYFSEDPYLAGTMAGHYCRGMESAGVASCIKHMIANNCETSRKRNQSIIGQRALRELYLRPFQVAMGIHMPASVMTAYNACNGCPTAADEELIQGFLREENGFDGFVMTDWTSYDTVPVAEMVEAGNCWITPGSQDDTYTKPIVDGVADGTIRLERLQENVAYIIKKLVKFA